jgi:hypothetical protein
MYTEETSYTLTHPNTYPLPPPPPYLHQMTHAGSQYKIQGFFPTTDLRLTLFVPQQRLYLWQPSANQRVLNDLRRPRLSRRCMIWLLPSPFSMLSLFLSSCVLPVELSDRRGGGARRRERLVLCKSFSTLWCYP